MNNSKTEGSLIGYSKQLLYWEFDGLMVGDEEVKYYKMVRCLDWKKCNLLRIHS